MKNSYIMQTFLIISNACFWVFMLCCIIAFALGYFKKFELPQKYQKTRVAYLILFLFGKISLAMYIIFIWGFIFPKEVIDSDIFITFTAMVTFATLIGLFGITGTIATFFTQNPKSFWYRNIWIAAAGTSY